MLRAGATDQKLLCSHVSAPVALKSKLSFSRSRRNSYGLPCRPCRVAALSSRLAQASAVAEKPEAEVSGEFGDYDDLLTRFKRADLDGIFLWLL